MSESEEYFESNSVLDALRGEVAYEFGVVPVALDEDGYLYLVICHEEGSTGYNKAIQLLPNYISHEFVITDVWSPEDVENALQNLYGHRLDYRSLDEIEHCETDVSIRRDPSSFSQEELEIEMTDDFIHSINERIRRLLQEIWRKWFG